MGVMCYIFLKKTEEGIYRAGQPVTGAVKYILDKATEFDSVEVSLIGKGKCHWSESDSDSTTSYSGNQQYVSMNRSLLPDGRNMIQNKGTYEHPFHFVLPQDIPSSFKNNICTIAYKIVVKFVKANFWGSSKKFDTELIVYGNVGPCSSEPLIVAIKKDLFSLLSSKSADIKIHIEKTFVTPGENIQLNIYINNNTDVPITAIKTELVRHFTYVSDSKSKLVKKEPVETTKGYSPSIKENSVSKFTCIVPTLPSLYTIQHTKILLGEYKLKVTAKFPFPHINASVDIPVVIGHRDYNNGDEALVENKPSFYETKLSNEKQDES